MTFRNKVIQIKYFQPLTYAEVVVLHKYANSSHTPCEYYVAINLFGFQWRKQKTDRRSSIYLSVRSIKLGLPYIFIQAERVTMLINTKPRYIIVPFKTHVCIRLLPTMLTSFALFCLSVYVHMSVKNLLKWLQFKINSHLFQHAQA